MFLFLTTATAASPSRPVQPGGGILKESPPNLEKGVKGGRNFLEVVYTGFHLLLNLSALVLPFKSINPPPNTAVLRPHPPALHAREAPPAVVLREEGAHLQDAPLHHCSGMTDGGT